jgi:hypothetical protein
VRKALLIALAVLAALVVIGLVAGKPDKPEDKPGTDGPGPAEQAAGCTPVVRTRPVPEGGKHRAGAISYAEAPPNAGEHNPSTLRNSKRFYSREDVADSATHVEQAVHDLEHGLVVGWYDATLPPRQVAALQAAASDGGPRFVAVPWTRSEFPGGRHFVLTAWGRTERCQTVSAEAIAQFVKDQADSDDAPEHGYSV